MTERTKGYARQAAASVQSAGVRVPRNKWAKFVHLSDEELRAKGIPARMLRRMRRKSNG